MDDFLSYKDIFISCCTNLNDPTFYEKLSQFGTSDNKIDFKNFLDYNVEMFQHPEFHERAQELSSILIKNAINVTPENFRQIQNKWINEEVSLIHQKIKNTILTGLSSQNDTVRNVCAAIIAIIAFIDETWQQLCIFLLGNIKDPESNHLLVFGCIRCLFELFNFPVLQQNPNFPDEFPDLLQEILHIMDRQEIDQLTLLNASQFLCLIITVYSSFFQNHEVIDSIINIIYKYIQNGTVDINIYQAFFNILIEIVQQCYNMIENHMQKIVNIVKEQILNTKSQYKCIALDFWREIALFEISLEEKNIQSNSLACRAAPEFVNLLLNCLIEIEDPQLTSAEDPQEITTHMVAASSLKALFTCNCQVIFETIKSFFDLIGDQSWIKVHAAIYSLSCLCTSPTSPLIFDFLEVALPLLIIHSGPQAMNLRTKETSMWVIGCILQTYGEIVRSGNITEELFNLFKSTMTPDMPPIVMNRSCRIFYHFSKNCNKGFLDENFDEILTYLMGWIQYYRGNEYVKKPFTSICALITNCTSESENKVLNLLQPFLSILLNINDNFECRSSAALVISTILKDYSQSNEPDFSQDYYKFIRDNALSIGSDLLKVISSECDFSIQECAFLAIANLIEVSKSQYSQIAMPTIELIFKALAQNDSLLVTTAIDTLSNIYQYIGFPGIDYFEKTSEILINLIKESNINVFSHIFRSFANMLRILNNPNIESLNEKLATPLVNILDLASKMIFPDSIPFDTLIEMYVFIIYGYYNLFVGLTKSKIFLFQRSNTIFEFIERISNSKLYDDDLLEHIYQLLYIMGSTLQTKINVKLNKQFVKKLLNAGMESNNQNLQEKARNLKVFLEDL